MPSGDKHQEKPLDAVSLTNDYIANEHGQLCMFATLFLGILNPDTGVLSYINGGHEPPAIVKSAGGIKQWLKPTGPIVGGMANINIDQTTGIALRRMKDDINDRQLRFFHL